jgi:hypothetical protein
VRCSASHNLHPPQKVFWGGCHFDTFILWSRLGEVSQDAVNVIKHRQLDLALHTEVQCRSQILVDLPTVHCHLAGPIFEHAFVFVMKSLDELVVGLGINAGHHAIINVEAAGLLFSINRSIANTPIVGIKFEAISFKGLHGLVVVEEAGNACAINRVFGIAKSVVSPLFVQTNKLL